MENRYFDEEIMDWVYIDPDDSEYVHDPWFWMDWSDLIGAWDHVA